jgi:hypothetical protein
VAGEPAARIVAARSVAAGQRAADRRRQHWSGKGERNHERSFPARRWPRGDALAGDEPSLGVQGFEAA